MGILDLLSGKTQSVASNPGMASRSQGLLDLLLGQDNPLSQFADSRQNTLGAIGAGIASGPTFAQGLANAAQGVPQARQLDQQTNFALQQQNATFKMLQGKYPDLAQAVLGGMPLQTAWQQALQREAPRLMHPGDYLADYSGKPLPGSGNNTNAPYGNDIKSWAYRTIQTAPKDSPEYAEAANIIQTQNMTMQPDGHGGMVPVMTQQPLPQGFAPPTYGASAPAAGGAPAAAGGGMSAPGGGSSGPVSGGAPVPGISQTPTETQQRYGILC